MKLIVQWYQGEKSFGPDTTYHSLWIDTEWKPEEIERVRTQYPNNRFRLVAAQE